MTFAAYEASYESGRPTELYEFVIGSTEWRYNNSEITVTVDAKTYTAETIFRGAFTQDPDNRKQPVIVSLPRTNEFVQQYGVMPPGQRALLTIKKYHSNDPDLEVVLAFTGVVQTLNFAGDGTQIDLAVIPLESALARSIPRYTFQGLCNHVVYDDQCGVNEDDPSFKLSAAVSAQDGYTITVPGASGFSDGWFNGGFVALPSDTDFRLILDHTGDVLTLLAAFPSSVVGTTVAVRAGCDHDINGDCYLKFDNVTEHGGCAFVPLKNVFQTGVK